MALKKETAIPKKLKQNIDTQNINTKVESNQQHIVEVHSCNIDESKSTYWNQIREDIDEYSEIIDLTEQAKVDFEHSKVDFEELLIPTVLDSYITKLCDNIYYTSDSDVRDFIDAKNKYIGYGSGQYDIILAYKLAEDFNAIITPKQFCQNLRYHYYEDWGALFVTMVATTISKLEEELDRWVRRLANNYYIADDDDIYDAIKAICVAVNFTESSSISHRDFSIPIISAVSKFDIEDLSDENNMFK